MAEPHGLPSEYDPHLAISYLLMRHIEEQREHQDTPDAWTVFWQRCAVGGIVLLIASLSFMGHKVLSIDNEMYRHAAKVERIEPIEQRLNRLEVDTEKLRGQVISNQRDIDALRELLTRGGPGRAVIP